MSLAAIAWLECICVEIMYQYNFLGGFLEGRECGSGNAGCFDGKMERNAGSSSLYGVSV